MKKYLFILLMSISSNFLMAQVDEKLTEQKPEFSENEQEPTELNLKTISPPTENTEVGEIGGELSVSNTGAAVYNIPIEVPKGKNNVAPKLSIVYNSQAGHGLAGYGWDISGLSVIRRVPRTIHHDGVAGSINNDVNDRFALDGQRLILKTGVYGEPNSTYETEVFSNLRITLLEANGLKHFKVEYPDGAYALYGDNANANTILAYHMTYWQNPQNLSIIYSYIKPNNISLIDKIWYGGIGSSTQWGNNINWISFNYKNRNRPIENFDAGIRMINDKVISNIITSSLTSNPSINLRHYYLNHDTNTNNYDRLMSLELKTGDNTLALKPMTFVYETTSDSVNWNESAGYQELDLNVQNHSSRKRAYGDFENNLVHYQFYSYPFPTSDNYKIQNYKTEVNNHFIRTNLNESNTHLTNIPNCTGDGTKRFFNIVFSEYDNGVKVLKNGVLEVRFLHCNQGTSSSAKSLEIKVGTFINDIYTLKYETTYPLAANATIDYSTFLNSDIDSNGISKVFFTIKHPNPDIQTSCYKGVITFDINFTIDVDNCLETNNLPEATNSKFRISRAGNTITVYKYNEDTGKFNEGYFNYFINGISSCSLEKPTLDVVDVNNDGKEDIILGVQQITYNGGTCPCWNQSITCQTKTIGIEILYNTGLSFISKYFPVNIEGNVVLQFDTAIDVNNDGLTEFVFGSNGHRKLYFFDGNFNLIKQFNFNDQSNNYFFRGTDYHKKTFYGLMQLRGNNYGYYNYKPIFFNKDHQKDKLLKEIRYGNGNKEEIKYESLINENIVYTAATVKQSYPNVDIVSDPNFKVVSRIDFKTTNSDLLEFKVWKIKTFKYHGAVGNYHGLGLIGFQATRSTNWALTLPETISSVTKFDMTKMGAPIETFSKLGLIEPNHILQPNESFISRSLHTYNHEDTAYVNPLLPNKVFKLFKTKSIEIDGLKETSIEKNIIYNNNNNPLQIVSALKNGNTLEKTTTQIAEYDPPIANPYIIDRPKKNTTNIQIYPVGDVANFHSAEEEYTYEVNLLKEVKKRTTNSGQTTPFITETTGHDAFGNVTSKTIAAPGLAARTSTFQYDTWGLYITKVIDPELLETVYTYDYTSGQVKTELLPSNTGFPLLTTYNYDKWGKLTSAVDYLGKTTTFEYKNVSGNRGVLEIQYAPDNITTKTFYDPLGRVIHQGGNNLNFHWSLKTTNYNLNNQPIKITKEYYENSTPTVWDEIQYDVYGRVTQAHSLKTAITNGKITTFVYDKLKTTENDATTSKETIVNASGLTVSLKENTAPPITYRYYANDNMRSLTQSGRITTVTQDGFGRKITLVDPSAGTRQYEYNHYGEAKKEIVVGSGDIEYDYDNVGKLIEKRTMVNGTMQNKTTYNYNPTTKVLSSMLFNDYQNGKNINYTYGYDNYKRLNFKDESANEYYFQQAYHFDGFGRLEKELYTAINTSDMKRSDKWIKYEYRNGDLRRIYDMPTHSTTGQVLWQKNTVNANGTIRNASYNNFTLNHNQSFDNVGLPTKNRYNVSNGGIDIELNMVFNATNGNLNSRSNNIFGPNAWSETFSYDNYDRLRTWKDHQGNQTQNYSTNGNITSNKIGSYAYTISGKPFLASTITPTQPSAIYDYYANREQNITYNVNKKPITITEQNVENIDFEYNAFNERSIMYYGNTQANKLNRSFRKYYSADGSMEIKRNVNNPSDIEFITYIGGDAYSSDIVLRSDGTTQSYFYLFKDYQGTINAIINQSNQVVERRLFDAWGTLIQYSNSTGSTTIPTTINGLMFQRGYTSHEHLLSINLINMNGRLYDNNLHRFLQPDNYIQDPTKTQNYNRYSYVMNNPTKYTDPDGEWWFFIPMIFSAYAHGVHASGGNLNPLEWNSQAWQSAAFGGLSAGASYGATNYVNTGNFGFNGGSFVERPGGTYSVNTFLQNVQLFDQGFDSGLQNFVSNTYKGITEGIPNLISSTGDALYYEFIEGDRYTASSIHYNNIKNIAKGVVSPITQTYSGINHIFDGNYYLAGEQIGEASGGVALTIVTYGGGRVVGGFSKIPKSVPNVAAKTVGKAIVLGEGMGAVKATAKTLQSQGVNAKWYQAWSKNFPTNRLMTPAELSAAQARNARWLNTKINQGYKIYDIGIDASRATRSPFYQLERSILQQRGYPTTILPR